MKIILELDWPTEVQHFKHVVERDMAEYEKALKDRPETLGSEVRGYMEQYIRIDKKILSQIEGSGC